MAWYAELKRRKWYCINAFDAIGYYRKKLYDDWYNSLTDEQKQRLEEYRKAKAEKEHREAELAMAMLFGLTHWLERETGFDWLNMWPLR